MSLPDDIAEQIDQLIHDAELAEAGVEAAIRTGNHAVQEALSKKAQRCRADAWVLMATGGKQETGGRPSKFTGTTICKVLEAVAVGATYDIVANFARISETTLYDWLQRGKKGEAGFSEFSEAVHANIAQAGIHALQAWRTHFHTDFKAPRDFMARRFADNWSPTIKQQQIGPPEDKPSDSITIVIEGPQAQQFIEAMGAARSGLEPPKEMLEVTNIIDGTAREKLEEPG